MDNKISLPSVQDFLSVTDPDNKLSRQKVGADIGSLATASAIQIIYDKLTAEQKSKIDQILQQKLPDSTSKIVNYILEIGLKADFSLALADTSAFWVENYILETYQQMPGEIKTKLDEKWPQLKTLILKKTF